MTGQHENKNLLSKSYHLDLLDQYVGAYELRGRYQKKYAQWMALSQEIERFERESKDKSQRLDFLRYQRDEIVALELTPGEDVEIENELKIQKNSARLIEFVEFAEQALDGQEYSALQALHKVVLKAQEMQNVDPTLLTKSQGLVQAKALIEDGLYEIRSHLSKVEGDPGRLEKLEAKWSSIRKLQKKFGPTVDDILKSLTELETEIGHLENADVHIQGMIKQRNQLSDELWKMGNDLHKRRDSGSKLLADSVNEELKDLNMKGVSFHVEVTRLQDLASTGLSDVEFQSQTSARDPKRALAKFASGGELSRILLSLKRVVGSGGQPRTYLFDEVDTGVSGPTAEKVGKKLRSIAKDQQVICVTHLPQVAAFADNHFYIQKSPNKSSVAMEVSKLAKKERIEEIARLISGQKVTKTSLAHAEVLLKQAHS